MINVVLMTQIVVNVLVVIKAMICILMQVNKMDSVFTLPLMMLIYLMLDAKFGTGILINVLSVLNIGILSMVFVHKFQAIAKPMIKAQGNALLVSQDTILPMDHAFIPHLILLVLLTLAVRLGLVEFVNNVLKVGLLVQIIFAQLSPTFVRLTKA